MCMRKREDSCTPSREYHDTLNAAGIGKKRVVFDKSGNHQYFVKKMEEEFPKLARQQGAIEVLRSSGGGVGTRGLVVIPLESLQDGYSIPSLKTSLGSAVLYVRPLQIDLPLTIEKSTLADSPMVRCIHCSLEVPLTDLREHHASLHCSVAVPGSSTTSVPQAGSQVSGAHNNFLAVPAGPRCTCRDGPITYPKICGGTRLRMDI